MSEDAPREKTDWRRIGVIAAVTLVPGGFLLGAALALRRMRAEAEREVAESEPDEES
ncbi:hypothetical protein AB5I39_08300 [Sphingomonas sp. MMS24-J45]|uniref:hypothetical protein n=1 Tax=Sphingomonas sp. MMS24-J45 TaxID=3238806 RepID=UPI0038517D02